MPKAPLAAAMATLLAMLALPLSAMAQEEELIPPGNSAVNQYTESLPTPGGKKNTESQSQKRPSPNKALGAGNTRRLAQQGPDGRAAAEAAAETAPVTETTIVSERDEEASVPPSGSGGGGDGSGKQAPGPDANRADAGGKEPPGVVRTSIEVDEPSGSSGFGEALGEATGASADGQMGWLLPLAILAIALWAVFYATRQRRRVS